MKRRHCLRVLIGLAVLGGVVFGWIEAGPVKVQQAVPEAVGDLDGDGICTVSDVVLCARLLLGYAHPAGARADLNTDGRIDTTDLMLLIRRVLSVDAENALYPGTGGTVTTPDGATVQFPADFGPTKITPSFAKIREASGEVIDDRKVVSAEYRLTVEGAMVPTSQVIVSLPVATTLLPSGWDETSFRPEYFDSAAQSWKSVGRGVFFDPARQVVSFDFPVSLCSAQTQASIATTSSGPSVLQAAGSSGASFRLQMYIFWRALTVYRPGSNFRLTYYPASLNKIYSIRSDSLWNSQTGQAVDPAVPDYIEDLDYALNQAYQELLKLQSSSGPVFAPLGSLPRDVWVLHLGAGIKGNTSLGGSLFSGSLSLSNELTNWTEMRLTAAHELVHVLQGQYYSAKGLITGQGGNRWFIEAVADYLAARVNALSDVEKASFYGQTMADYLSVAVTANNAQSYYTAAHFLDWLSHRRCQPTLVGDALKNGGNIDLTNLGAAIQKNGGTGLTTEFLDYLDFIVRNPQDYAQFNFLVKSTMKSHAQANYVPLRTSSFNDQRTFIHLEKRIWPLSATHLSLTASNDADGLLVIDPSASDDYPLDSVIFGFLSSKNSDYQGAHPLDESTTFQEMRRTPLTVQHFFKQGSPRAIEHTIGYGDASSSLNLHIAYYLLLPPSAVIGNGKVSWSHRVGNIPEGYIEGYNVFRNGIKQNKNTIPIDAAASSQEYLMPAVQSSDQVAVQVVDKYGNVWPEIAVPPVISSVKVNGAEVSDAGTTIDANFTVQTRLTSSVPLTELTYTYAGRPAVSVLSGGSVEGAVERTFNVTVADLADGDYTLAINAKDANGQTASLARHVRLQRVTPPPTGKVFISPPEGYERSWVLILSEGGFGATRGTSSVEFGKVPVPAKYYYSWSDNCLSLWVPDGVPLGNVPVVVKVNQTSIDAGTFKVLSRVEALQHLTRLEGQVEGHFIMSSGPERTNFRFENSGEPLKWSGSSFSWIKQWDSTESGVAHKGFSQITGTMNLVPFRPTLTVTWVMRDEGTRTVEEWTGSGYETKKVKFQEQTSIVITDLPDAFENKDLIPLPFAESFTGGSSHAQVTYSYQQEDDGTGQNKQNITIVSSQIAAVGCWFY